MKVGISLNNVDYRDGYVQLENIKEVIISHINGERIRLKDEEYCDFYIEKESEYNFIGITDIFSINGIDIKYVHFIKE